MAYAWGVGRVRGDASWSRRGVDRYVVVKVTLSRCAQWSFFGSLSCYALAYDSLGVLSGRCIICASVRLLCGDECRAWAQGYRRMNPGPPLAVLWWRCAANARQRGTQQAFLYTRRTANVTLSWAASPDGYHANDVHPHASAAHCRLSQRTFSHRFSFWRMSCLQHSQFPQLCGDEKIVAPRTIAHSRLSGCRPAHSSVDHCRIDSPERGKSASIALLQRVSLCECL